jgi:hypothetical protein
MGTFSIWHLIILLVIFPAILALYFLPAIIAFNRRHHNRLAILLLNVLLGWSGLGWVAALIWAVTAVRTDPAVRP